MYTLHSRKYIKHNYVQWNILYTFLKIKKHNILKIITQETEVQLCPAGSRWLQFKMSKRWVLLLENSGVNKTPRVTVRLHWLKTTFIWVF